MNIIDLTLKVEPGMRGVEFETKYTVTENGWNAKTLHLYSHSGTHMDSPFHFEAGPQTIDQIPLADCIGKAWLIDLDDIPPKTPITVQHLGVAADQIAAGDAILLRTLWSRHVRDASYYRDNFPPISPELAQWMVDRKIRMVGVEPPSVADVNDLPAVTLIHKILLGANIIIVEGLTNLEQLNGPTCLFGALPLKIADGDGAPCRAFAIDGAAELFESLSGRTL
ncbi:cyclase family protein [Planctomycetes bacterium K23_9]|uniref:Kynurenine formamidase n=1 Tax=Stieleria marina TaxID=1930275 RepID=A0A517NMN2_9BACT|nr:Kynurenine formamidase [Planctomycetes bacterium K23_9]